MRVYRRRFLRAGAYGLAGTWLMSCSPASAPIGPPAVTSVPPPTPKPAAAPTTSGPVPTTAPKPPPATVAPTAVIGKLEQTSGKLLLISGLFDNMFSRMALEKGFFKDVGLEVGYTDIGSGAAVRAALLAGEADVVELGSTLVPVAIEQGAPVKIVGVPKPKQNLLFYSKKSISSLTDLYDKAIGTGSVGAPVYVLVQALFEKYKADISKANLVSIGTSAELAKALIAGKVDAAASGVEMQSQIEATGELKVLYDLAAEIPEFVRVVLAATDRTIRDKPNFLAAFLTAYSRGIRHAIDNRNDGIGLARKLSPADAQTVESAYDWYVKNRVMDPNLAFPPDAYTGFQKLMVKVGVQSKELSYEQTVDLSAQKKMIAVLGSYAYRP